MCYAFEQVLANGILEITEDRKAVALWRKNDAKKMSLPLLKESLLFFFYFGLTGMNRIREMEKIVQKHYPKEKSFLYLWFIGTLPSTQGQGYGSALLKPILEDSETKRIDVYLETSTSKNVNYYLNRGFEVYNKVILGAQNEIILSLMKKSANG
jgi:ribosomal protein S18 acetylase RimI-like enzyme